MPQTPAENVASVTSVVMSTATTYTSYNVTSPRFDVRSIVAANTSCSVTNITVVVSIVTSNTSCNVTHFTVVAVSIVA